MFRETSFYSKKSTDQKYINQNPLELYFSFKFYARVQARKNFDDTEF